MDHALVLIGVFAVFIPTLMLPGPDFVAVVRSSMTYGTRAGLLTTLGVRAVFASTPRSACSACRRSFGFFPEALGEAAETLHHGLELRIFAQRF